jgi:hypothetical protein
MTAVPVNQIICGDNVETLRTLPDACGRGCCFDSKIIFRKSLFKVLTRGVDTRNIPPCETRSAERGTE